MELDQFPAEKMFFRIGEVSDILGVKPHVIRYWETEFPEIVPKKSSTGHRVYERKEVQALMQIHRLLHVERFSIEGARKKLKGDVKRVDRVSEKASVSELVLSLWKDRLQKLKQKVDVRSESFFKL
jgi:DNA-binding transcriptional MerR regulator